MASIFGYSKTPEPAYELVKKAALYEVRQYAPQLRAITDRAPEGGANDAFRQLAGFIFGKNKAQGRDGNEKIAMTAPVAMNSYAEPPSEKIAMTAPVAMSGRTMAFVMPDKYKTLADLPTPLSDKVKLMEVPACQMAIIRFSGNWGNKEWLKQQEKILRDAVAQDGIELSTNPGDVQLWAFNPPWTLPMFKRNEIAIPLTKPLPVPARGDTATPSTVPAATPAA